jgi:hypothetical protein
MQKLKYWITLFIIFFVLWKVYFLLEEMMGDNWIAFGIFFVLVVGARIAIFMYRRSKGIRDEYID